MGVNNSFSNTQDIKRDPIIVSGYWVNVDDNWKTTTRADLGEEMLFCLQVRNIEAGEKVELSLFEKNVFQKDTDLSKKYECTIDSIGRGSVKIELDKAWSKYLDETGEGDELEIFFKAKYKDKKKDLSVLEVYDPKLITVLVEKNLEINGEKEAVGHSGIIINDDYYDFGPGGGMLGSVGKPWWDEAPVQKREADGSISDINPNKDLKRTHISVILNSPEYRKNMNIKAEVVLVDIYITKRENKMIEKYWKSVYDSLHIYSILPFVGSQCTTTVRQSIEKCTNVFWITDFSQQPDALVELLINNGEHTCGKHKGDKLTITQIFPAL